MISNLELRHKFLINFSLIFLAIILPLGCDSKATNTPVLQVEKDVIVAAHRIDHLAASDDLKWLVSIVPHHTCTAYDCEADNCFKIHDFIPDPNQGAGHRKIAFIPKTHVVVLPSPDELSIIYWDCDNRKISFKHDPVVQRIEQIYLSPDGTKIAYVTRDSRIYFANVYERGPISFFQYNGTNLAEIMWINFVSNKLASIISTQYACTVDINTGILWSEGERLSVSMSSLAPCYDTIVVGKTHFNELLYFDVQNWNKIDTITMPRMFQSVAGFSRNRIAALIYERQGTGGSVFGKRTPQQIEIWDTRTQKCLAATTAVPMVERCEVQLSADKSKIIAWYSATGRVQLYDISLFKE